MEYRYGGNRTNSGCTWTMWQYTCTNGQMRTTCATWNATRSVVIQHGIRNTIDRSIRGMPIAWTNAQKCSNAQLLKCSNATNAQHYKMHHAQKCSNATNATNTQNCTTNCSNAQGHPAFHYIALHSIPLNCETTYVLSANDIRWVPSGSTMRMYSPGTSSTMLPSVL